jgi:putative transposase
MPQSLAMIYVHLVFSTKNRARLLPDEIRNDLHSYMSGILREMSADSIQINTEPDHAHFLFQLPRPVAFSEIIGELKRGSTIWIQKQSSSLREFKWQAGYGAFSVSKSNIAAVQKYIINQRQHHRVLSFQDEFRELLRKHEIEFDERYVWD